ncbi:MAG: PHP domain-containing protein [Spirochaetales bacterium]|nr:PHP domain-containing protein [Spirochaetales bacterium]
MILTDLHIHSKYSDGLLTLAEIVDLYGAAGFDVIAITDHITSFRNIPGWIARKLNLTVTEKNFDVYYRDIMNEKQRAWNKYNMLVIPGFELSHNTLNFHHNFHIVALGMSRFVSADQSPKDICAQIADMEGASIAAHPVHTGEFEPQTYYLWENRHELCVEFDAWEAANGKRFFNEVFESGLPMIANSDLHKMEQMSSWRTVMDANKNEKSVFQAIKNQDLELIYYKYESGRLCYPERSSKEKSLLSLECNPA